MKKKKKNKLIKFVFYCFVFSFLIIYFSEATGYYEYQNYAKKELTNEQVKQFEKDVASGKEVDINKYLIVDDVKYNNKLSDLSSNLSLGISNIIKSGVENLFKLISKLMQE